MVSSHIPLKNYLLLTYDLYPYLSSLKPLGVNYLLYIFVYMLEIKCINKSDRDNPRERITHIWWMSDWKSRKITQQEAVHYIKSKQYSFYVLRWWVKVNVVVARSRFWNEYIKTEWDGEGRNNLLELMECK